MIEAAVTRFIERTNRRPLEPMPWQVEHQRRVAEQVAAAVALFEANENYLEVCDEEPDGS